MPTKYRNATKLSRKHIISHKIHKIHPVEFASRAFHRVKSSDYLRILILRTIGNFLILGSLFMIAKTFYIPVKEEITYFINAKFQKTYVVVSPQEQPPEDKQATGGLAKLFQVKQIEALVPQDPNFSVVIPKIGANARVLANVDAANDKVYLAALQKGVAHAAGTAFPGEGGHIFLFAHSTDYIWNVGTYNGVFYLLPKVNKGDEIDIFYKGQRYVYRVVDKVIVDPSRVEYITRKTNKEFVTLQTCWPPGTTLQRLLVFATRVAE